MSARTRRTPLVFGLFVALSCGLAVAAGSCTRAPLKLCGVIPEGGCPIGRGGTCDDPSCAGVYDCIDGNWTLEVACSPTGAGGNAGSSSSSSQTPTGGCVPAQLDHTGETIGCEPDLADYDCPIAAAEACNPCATACVDFFICRSVGWEDVAYCTEEGELVILR